MVVLIDKVHEGHRGTLVHLVDHDGPLYYDDDQPILDTTVDGWSVYHVQAWQGGIQQGRVIDHESKHEWEVIQ
jgi:hypothetical protein